MFNLRRRLRALNCACSMSKAGGKKTHKNTRLVCILNHFCFWTANGSGHLLCIGSFVSVEFPVTMLSILQWPSLVSLPHSVKNRRDLEPRNSVHLRDLFFSLYYADGFHRRLYVEFLLSSKSCLRCKLSLRLEKVDNNSTYFFLRIIMFKIK